MIADLLAKGIAGIFIIGLIALLFLGILGVMIGVSGLIAYLLWNALAPALFNGPHISYWTGVLIAIALEFVGMFFSNNSKSS